MGAEVCIKLVMPYELSTYWPRAIPWLERGRKYWEHLYDLTDLYIELFAGRMQLWLVGQPDDAFGCFITEIRSFPKAKMLAFIYAGGEEDDLDKLSAGETYHDYIVTWAKERGCKFSRIEGRKGWERIGQRLGYKNIRVYMTKNLDRE